jgi:hypothetical protein
LTIFIEIYFSIHSVKLIWQPNIFYDETKLVFDMFIFFAIKLVELELVCLRIKLVLKYWAFFI